MNADAKHRAGIIGLAGRALWPGAAAFFLCAAQAPPGDRWRLLTRDETGTAYFDPATLERDGDARTIHARLFFPAVDEDGTASVLIIYRFDCARHVYAASRITSLRADGSPIREVEITGAELTPRPARAESNIRRLLDAVCGL